MPITKDDLDDHPEWGLHINVLQGATLVLQGQCRASDTGQNMEKLMNVCCILGGASPLQK